jgi:hypothetical protein
MVNVIFAAVVTGAFYPIPNGPFGHPGTLQVLRHPMNERSEKVWLQGEIAIGRLHPVALSYAADFIGETPLQFGAAHVLDY